MEIQRTVGVDLLTLKEGEYLNPQIQLRVLGENWGRLTLRSYVENYIATGIPKCWFNLQHKNKKVLQLVLRTEMTRGKWPDYSNARHLPEVCPTFYIAHEHRLIKRSSPSPHEAQAKMKENFILHINFDFGFERMNSDDKVSGKLEIDEKEYKELKSLMDDAERKNLHLKLSIRFERIKIRSGLSVTT